MMTNNWIPREYRSVSPMYRAIARAIETDVSNGVLKPGDMLPTHRDLADKLGVAIGTITRAYREAEKRGLIEGRGRCGTFVRNHKNAGSTLSKMISNHSCDDSLVYTVPYGAPVPDFSRTLKRLWSRPGKNSYRYWPPESNRPDHCVTGVKWLSRLGYDASPDSVVVTPGNHHGILAALATELDSGDSFAAEEHTYLGLPAIAEFLGLRMVGIETDQEGVLPDALESACKRFRIKALHVTPCVQNPTNATMSEQRRRDIVAVAARYGVMLVEDEVTRAIVDDPPTLLKDLAPDLCYLLASPSKVLCPGLRIGYAVAPSGAKQRLLDTLRATLSYPGGLPSEVLGQMLTDGTADVTLAEVKAEAKARQQMANEVLSRELTHTNPASHYLWLDLPDYWNAPAFASEAKDAGLPVIPADAFAINPVKAARAVRVLIGVAHNQAAFRETLLALSGMLKRKPRYWRGD